MEVLITVDDFKPVDRKNCPSIRVITVQQTGSRNSTRTSISQINMYKFKIVLEH